MADVRLRTAELSDVGAVVELNNGLIQEDAGHRDPFTNINWAHEEGNAHFTRHIMADNSKVLVAELDGNVAGYLVGYVGGPNSLRPIKAAVLESMYVLGSVRNRGVGERLIEAFLTWCAEQGAQRISVTAYASNDGAIRFYKRLGFKPKNVSLERTV